MLILGFKRLHNTHRALLTAQRVTRQTANMTVGFCDQLSLQWRQAPLVQANGVLICTSPSCFSCTSEEDSA